MRKKILVIDDSEAIHALVRAPLQYDPIDVHHARDGASGITMAATLVPDLVLLDVEMPDVDGFEVCRRLKANPTTRNIAVLFLTAAGSVAERVRGLTMGAVDYVIKPFHPSELRARVCASLRGVVRTTRSIGRCGYDDQTNLWSREYFDHRFIACLSESRRYNRPVSVILIDIDHLAATNSLHGQHVGDRVLRTLAQRLLSESRGEDIACRFAGGAFAMICPSLARNQAVKFAVRLWQGVASRPVHFGDKVINLKCSLGVASLDDQKNSDLVTAAEAALLRAKRAGGNQVVAAPPATPAVVSQAA